jgi:predicted acylesterase/phospholipase RssA
MPERKKCDIVLEGGITSGAVYPGFVCKLAEYYDFQSIGGTSAGAIAAALGAAAQYARNLGKATAFDAVAQVPAWLGAKSAAGKGTNLFSLFQPSAATTALFDLATSLLVPGWIPKLEAWASVLWLELALGLLPGALLAYLAWHDPSWPLGILIVFVALLLSAASVAIVVLLSLAVRIGKLGKHHFGLCTGYAAESPEKPYALVPWLNEQINTIAGKDATEPLTFGDLKAQGINLRMMTTCFTWGRPFTMPFEQRIFYFCPMTFRDYFPEEVVVWMERHPPQNLTPSHEPIDLRGYLPLPDENDLPVIVATRLSLSFPGLFCAVPLAAVDFSLRRCAQGEVATNSAQGGSLGHDEARTPEVVWFTDGGICNNFPLHLFDGPLPLWPTFGIQLADIRADRPADEGRAWVPNSNGSAMQPRFTRIQAESGLFKPLAQIGAVAGAIIDSARNWVNSLQSVVPGYRDRIVHVYLTKKEGGLNLNMSTQLVANLSNYGADAAQRLIDHFIHGLDNGLPTIMTWENQRWVRYRSSITLLETFLKGFATAMNNPEPGDPRYSTLIANGSTRTNEHGYPLDPSQVPMAVTETDAVVALGSQMANVSLQQGAPHPEPALVVRPDF